MATLLNESDIMSINGPVLISKNDIGLNIGDFSGNTFNVDNSVTPKIIAARKDPRIGTSHIIDPSNFDVIYATSDIHADIRNFLNYLNKLKMIKLPDGLDLYNKNDIYNPRFITETDWIMKKSLLVIIGDLVDGKREKDNFIVDDDEGKFEYMLHMLIYNLRIKAWSKESDIIFTIGNHDIYNAIETNYNNEVLPFINNTMVYSPYGLYGNYITNKAKHFFTDLLNPRNTIKSLLNRKSALGIFYLLSPFLFIQIKNEQTDILMIHSHIMNKNNFDKLELDELRKFQNEIDFNIVDQTKLYINKPDISNILTTLTGRNVEVDVELCKNYKKNQKLIPNIIVVGHCPTIYSIGDSNLRYNKPHIKSIIKGKTGKDEEYENCNDDEHYGCVIPRCYENEQDIRIIMVDTGMSSCFRKSVSGKELIKKEIESNRFSEILKIVHDNPQNKAYKNFNKLYRLRTDNREIIIKPTSEAVRGSWNLPFIPDSLHASTSIWPYPLTIDFIEKFFKEDYPNMPADKMKILMEETKKMDLSEFQPNEFIFPKLPKDFWIGSSTFKEKYEKYKSKYLYLKNKINKKLTFKINK